MPARNYIEVVEKAFRILEALAAADRPLGLAEISTRTGLVKSTAFRLLYTLRELGYVEREAVGGAYSLHFRVLSLADSVRSKATLTRIARPHLVALRDELDESAWLAERRPTGVYFVDVIEAHHPLRLLLKLGDVCPIHAGAAGKAVAAFLEEVEIARLAAVLGFPKFTGKTIGSLEALLAHLAGVRRRGYAVNDEETVEGGIALGAPLFDAAGEVIGAISVTAPTTRWKSGKLELTGRHIREIAGRISTDLRSVAYRYRWPAPIDNPDGAGIR